MEQNAIISEIIRTVRQDIINDKDFIKSIIGDYELKEENIPASLIITLMNVLNNKSEQVRAPQSNAPKQTGTVAKPVVVGQDSQTAKIISDLLEGNNVYLMGKAGTGKTYLAKAIAQSVLGQPDFTINCSQWTSPIEIRGGQTIRGYVDGELIKAWAEGGIIILDELPKLDPNTAGLLNDALAEAASQPKYDSNKKIIESTIPYITNGKGEKVYKGARVTEEILGKKYDDLKSAEKSNITKADYIKQGMELKFRFCVIATGNTDMMNVGNKYGGNQRQDYSLVDRFAGSFYTLDVDVTKEKSLTYSYVFKVSNALRLFLQELDAPQSISLRTMLNFNRTYEQQKLYTLGNSVFADAIYDSNGRKVAPKSIKDSLTSFKSLLEPEMRKLLDFDVKGADFRAAVDDASLQSDSRFKLEFIKKYRLDPKTGAEVSKEELERIEKDLDLMTQKNK